MDTQEPLADTAVSSVVEEEIIQEKEDIDNVHEHTFNTATAKEPTVKTEADPEKNDVQKSMDNTTATKEPTVKMEVD